MEDKNCPADFKKLWFADDPEEREKLQDAMQLEINKISKKEFDLFDSGGDIRSSDPVLDCYDQCLERVLRDIPAACVEPGTAVIWYLYNMGVVIKTPEACFGVDIHHRHADKLEPLLDFIAVTHNHNDHYNLPLMQKMNAAQKPVISNFFPNFAYTKAPFFTHTVKGVTIHCSESDHNAILKKFNMPMEFVCPTGNKSFVFFTSGDCSSHEFLEKRAGHTDLYLLHPRCLMKAAKAVEKLDPEMTFIGHLQELGHDVDMYRWPFTLGRQELEELQKIAKKGYIPAWGEKFLWDGKRISGCQK